MEEEEEEEEIECRTEEPTEAQKYARKKRIPLMKDLFGWLVHYIFFHAPMRPLLSKDDSRKNNKKRRAINYVTPKKLSSIGGIMI